MSRIICIEVRCLPSGQDSPNFLAVQWQKIATLESRRHSWKTDAETTLAPIENPPLRNTGIR
jgi:hypothetical protein